MTRVLGIAIMRLVIATLCCVNLLLAGASVAQAQDAPVVAEDTAGVPVEAEDADAGAAVPDPPTAPAAGTDPAGEPTGEPAEPAVSAAALPEAPEPSTAPAEGPEVEPKPQPAAEADAADADDSLTEEQKRWFEEYKELAGAYMAVNKDYEGALRGYMVAEIQARIDASDGTREELVMGIREKEAERRREAMAALDSFLARYQRYKDDPQYREHIADGLFRLAELHRDHSEYEMDLNQLLFDQRMQEYDWGIRPSPPSEEEANYARALELYLRVVHEFKDYRYRDMVMYLAGYYLRLSEELEQSNKVLRGLVTTYPDSFYAMGAWMLIGHNSYDSLEYKVALEAYGTVASKKENNDYYEDALYRLGWASFEEFKYVPAINSFLQLLEYGEEMKGRKKQRLVLRREAVESIANSFVDEDWDGDDMPDFEDATLFVQRALSHINRDRPYEKDILKQFGDLLFDLKDSKHFQQSVMVYGEYLRRYPMDSDNPLIHDRIVYSYYELSQNPTLPPAERDRYARLGMDERRRMAELYGRGSKWEDMHRYDAAALKQAAEKLSVVLLERAELLHQMAMEKKEELGKEAAQSDYRAASGALQDFLDQFPKSSKRLDILRRLADVQMFGLSQFYEAAETFRQLRDAKKKNNPYLEESAGMVMEALAKIIAAAEAAKDPALPIPEGLFDLKRGTTLAMITPQDDKDPTKPNTVTPVEIPAVVLDWTHAVAKYLTYDFAKQDRASAGALEYSISKVYLRYGHFEEARKRCEAILKEYKTDKILPLYCYTDFIRTFRLENDLDNLEKIAQRMKAEGRGEADDIEKLLKGITKVRLDARLGRAGELISKAQEIEQKEGEVGGSEGVDVEGPSVSTDELRQKMEFYTKAAHELEKIVDETPDYDKADTALIGAAQSFEKIKYYDKAARLYKRLVEEDRFRESKHRASAIMSLAENYEKFFNFAGAVRIYGKLPAEYPDDSGVKKAMLKRAELLENDQRYVEAAEAVTAYLKEFPKDANAPKLRYVVATLYEKGEDKAGMERTFKAFLKRYGKAKGVVVNVMIGHLKLGRLEDERGNKRTAQSHFKAIVSLYEKSGQKSGGRAAGICAEANFRLAESKFYEYEAIKIVGRSKQQRKAGKQKLEKLKELEAIYGKITDYGSPKWIVAAFFKVGSLWKDLSVSFASAPYPKDAPQDEDAKYEYQIAMGDLKARFEDNARQYWRNGAEIAKKTGIYDEWTYKILVELNRYEEDRLKYPLFRELKQYSSQQPLLHFPVGE